MDLCLIVATDALLIKEVLLEVLVSSSIDKSMRGPAVRTGSRSYDIFPEIKSSVPTLSWSSLAWSHLLQILLSGDAFPFALNFSQSQISHAATTGVNVLFLSLAGGMLLTPPSIEVAMVTDCDVNRLRNN
jgi:hypothetical protein